MALKYTAAQRKLYLGMTDNIGANWVDVFQGDTEFYSTAYWDLLTNIWCQDEAVCKTDALQFMTRLKSAHTAGKYIKSALQRGFLLESDPPPVTHDLNCSHFQQVCGPAWTSFSTSRSTMFNK